MALKRLQPDFESHDHLTPIYTQKPGHSELVSESLYRKKANLRSAKPM